jgi:hypothetical protein
VDLYALGARVLLSQEVHDDFTRRAVAMIVLVLGTGSALVQGQECFQIAEYSAKFLCGVVEERGSTPVRPGAYETSINIHNPEIVPSVTLLMKVVLAPPERWRKRAGPALRVPAPCPEGGCCRTRGLQDYPLDARWQCRGWLHRRVRGAHRSSAQGH